MMIKRCRRCGVEKAGTEFSPEANLTGLKSHCKKCMAEKARIRRSDPVKAELDRRTSLAWKRRNPAPPKPRRTPEQGTPEWEERRSWAKRVTAARYHAKRMGVEVNDLRLRDWLEVVEEFGRRCFYCQASGDLWIDHVIPIAKGGPNTKSNIVPSCEMCNRKKSKRSAEQFRANLCHRGHPLYGDNLYIYPDGKSYACKECRRAAFRRYRAKKKASV